MMVQIFFDDTFQFLCTYFIIGCKLYVEQSFIPIFSIGQDGYMMRETDA